MTPIMGFAVTVAWSAIVVAVAVALIRYALASRRADARRRAISAERSLRGAEDVYWMVHRCTDAEAARRLHAARLARELLEITEGDPVQA
jgi:hypothetical protein